MAQNKRYTWVTVRSYKDPDMAGLPRDNRERGKWFVHGIRNGKADLITIEEKKSNAKKKAREAAKSERSGSTTLVVKDLEGEVTSEKTYQTETTTFSP